MNIQQKNEKFDDHLFVALSVIIGLAITSFLENIALLIKNRALVEFYYPQMILAFIVFFWAIQFWWGLWKFQDIKWNFQTFFLFVGLATSLFLMNNLIFPEFEIGQAISIRSYYYQIHSWFYAISCFWFILSIIKGVSIKYRPLFSKVNLAYGAGLIFSFILLGSNNSTLHEILILISIVFPIIGVVWGLDLQIKKSI